MDAIERRLDALEAGRVVGTDAPNLGDPNNLSQGQLDCKSSWTGDLHDYSQR